MKLNLLTIYRICYWTLIVLTIIFVVMIIQYRNQNVKIINQYQNITEDCLQGYNYSVHKWAEYMFKTFELENTYFNMTGKRYVYQYEVNK